MEQTVLHAPRRLHAASQLPARPAVIAHIEPHAAPALERHAQIEPLEIPVFRAAQPEVAALTHPRNALLLRPVVPREIPQRSVRAQRIQALPSARKANRLYTALRVPEPAPRVVYQQHPLAVRALRAQIVPSVKAPRRRVRVPLLAEHLRHHYRQAPVKHAHAARAVVVELPVHHLHAPPVTPAHAAAPRRHDLVRARRARIHPLQTVLLEENRAAQIVPRSR